MSRKIDPETQKKIDSLKRILEALAILEYDSIARSFPEEIKEEGLIIKYKYKLSARGQFGISSVRCIAEKKVKSLQYTWDNGRNDAIFAGSSSRCSLALSKTIIANQKVSSKVADIEIILDKRPNLEAKSYANDILRQELGMEDTYGVYQVELRGVTTAKTTVSVEAKDEEEAKEKAMDRALNWYAVAPNKAEKKVISVNKTV